MEKVLAKCGLSKNLSSRIQKRSKCFFRLSNLEKKQYEKQLRIILAKFQSRTKPSHGRKKIPAIFYVKF